MTIKNGWLYLPIETKVRELYGKVFLACIAAVNNFDIVIGSKREIKSRIHFLPKGLVFSFGLAKNFAQNHKKLREAGYKVAAIDEEGLVTLNDNLYLRYRISKETLKETDLFFCWGEKQASLIKKESRNTECEVFITGNPRFDMLRPEYKNVFNDDVKKIKEKYGKILLINTNFGHANHFSGEQFAIQSLKKKGWMCNPCDERYFLRRIEWQKEIYNNFLKIIPELSKRFKNYTIIIRPHPSENHEIWKEIEKKLPNVFIVHSGNVIPWIMSADALIHNGCTTAIEAFLLRTKTVAYRPLIVTDLESELPNKLSLQAYKSEELFDIINTAIHEDINSNKKKEDYLEYYLSGISKDTASEKIIHIIKSQISLKKGEINNHLLLFLNVLDIVKKIIKKMLIKAHIKNNDSEKYQVHKVSKLTRNEIEKIIEKFSNIDKRFSDLKIKRISDSCYHIYKT